MKTPIETVSEYERCVAGSIMLDGSVFPKVAKVITSQDFQFDVPARVFEAAQELYRSGVNADLATVLGKTGIDIATLRACIDATGGTAVNAEEYAKLVHDEAIKRKLEDLSERIATSGESTSELLAALHKELEAIESGRILHSLITSEEMLSEFWAKRKQVDEGTIPMVTTGFDTLDEYLGGGLINGGLTIIGASPGSGKTSLAINIADQVDGSVLFISCEMTPHQIMVRRMARRARISSKVLTSGNMTPEQYDAAAKETLFFTSSGVVLSRNQAPTVSQIAAMAADVKDLKMIVIDYLQLLRSENANASRYEAASELSRSLKQLAIKLDVPILCLSQLNRDNAKNKSKPTLASLRDSGQIEADADAVFLLYTDTDQDERALSRRVLLDISKNRHGESNKTIVFNAYMQDCIFEEERKKGFVAK